MGKSYNYFAHIQVRTLKMLETENSKQNFRVTSSSLFFLVGNDNNIYSILNNTVGQCIPLRKSNFRLKSGLIQFSCKYFDPNLPDPEFTIIILYH